MILAQVVFQILCSQDCFTVQNAKVRKETYFSKIFTEIRDIIQSNIYRIYTLGIICMPNTVKLFNFTLLIFAFCR